MDRATSLTGLEAEATRILELLDRPRAIDVPVPTCPGWTLGELANHLGRVYARVATVIQNKANEAPDRSSVPRRAEGQPPAEWLRERLDIVVKVLSEVDESERCWNFIGGAGSPVGFWWRRQAHETLIHRVDAELSLELSIGTPSPEVAADGIEDFLEIAGLQLVDWSELDLGSGTTIHLHAADVMESNAEWTLNAEAASFCRAHLKADIALRGPAWSLDRWCWGRGGGKGLEAFGDAQAAEAWRPRL